MKTLKNTELIKFIDDNPQITRYDIHSASAWLAAKCATSLSRTNSKMEDFMNFESGSEFTRTENSYAEWCENKVNEINEKYPYATDMYVEASELREVLVSLTKESWKRQS